MTEVSKRSTGRGVPPATLSSTTANFFTSLKEKIQNNSFLSIRVCKSRFNFGKIYIPKQVCFQLSKFRFFSRYTCSQEIEIYKSVVSCSIILFFVMLNVPSLHTGMPDFHFFTGGMEKF